MYGRNASLALVAMTEHDNDIVTMVTERFERRLGEECGKIRVEMANDSGRLRAEMAEGFGKLRVEMIDRNSELMKWGLVFGVTQTATIAGIVAMLR